MKNNSIIKKMIIYFIGTLSSRMLSVLLVPIYAFFVKVEELGKYDYIIAIVNIIMPIVYVVIWESILKYFMKDRESNILEKYISTVVVFFSMITIVFILISIVIGLYIEDKWMVFWITIFSIVLGALYIWQFAARALGENKRYVKAGIWGSAILIICDFLFIVFYKLDFLALMLANIVSQVFVIVIIEQKIHLLRRVKLNLYDIKILRMMLYFSGPLVINNISLWAYSSGGRIIIQNTLGATENGLYSFASKFSILINLFSTVISMAVIEEAYSFKTMEEYRIKMTKLIFIISKAYLGLVLFALPAIYILYSIVFFNTGYYISVDYIFLLLMGTLFTALANNYGSAFQVTNNTKYISITTIVGAICALGISLLLVKLVGIYGVLIGNVIGSAVMMLTRAIFAKKATGLYISWEKNILYIVLLMVSFLVLFKNKNLIVQIIIFIVIFLFLCFDNRSFLKKYYIKIKRSKK